MMRLGKALLSGIAALFLATGAAHATLDGCAVVLRTPDGFLNVRAAPKMEARILKRLKPGDIIETDSKSCEGSVCDEKSHWIHVFVAPGTPGWVVSRFVIGIDCENLPAPTTAHASKQCDTTHTSDLRRIWQCDDVCVHIFGNPPYYIAFDGVRDGKIVRPGTFEWKKNADTASLNGKRCKQLPQSQD